MAWLTLVVFSCCAVACFLAAEQPRAQGRAARWAAAGTLVALLPLLILSGPGAGFPTLFCLTLAALSGAGCLWFAKVHLDRRDWRAATVAGGLGLTLFALAVAVGVSGEAAVAPAPAAVDGDDSLDPAATRAAASELFAARERALERRLVEELPGRRRELLGDAARVKQDLERATQPAARGRLTDELRGIARSLLRLERQVEELQPLIQEVSRARHRLEGRETSAQVLGDDRGLFEELEGVWRRAGEALRRPLDVLGSGSLQARQVDQKLAELSQ